MSTWGRRSVCLICAGLFLTPLAGIARGSVYQSSTSATELRQQAAALRQGAGYALGQAKEWRNEAASRRQMAAEALVAAAKSRKKGDVLTAQSQERDARNDKYEADQRDAKALGFEKQAATLEKEAKSKDVAADELDRESRLPPVVVFRECGDAMRSAEEDLAAFQDRIRSQHLGHDHMPRTAIYTFTRDSELTSLTQADIDKQCLADTTELAAIEKRFAAERIAAGKPGANLNALMNSAYSDVRDEIRTLFSAIFNLEELALQDYYAVIYKQVQKLGREYAASEAEWRANDPLGAEAKLEQLTKTQHASQQPLLAAVCVPYRSDKNFIAYLRHEWIQHLNELHDVAAKLSKGKDVHADAAQEFTSLLSNYFTDHRQEPMSFGLWLDGSRSFSTGFDGYDWCVKGLYPDIQMDGRPDLLSMADVLNEKLPILITGRKDQGAAGDGKP